MDNTTLWEGKLPAWIDFSLIESHLQNLAGSLAGTCRSDTREIGFYPTHAHVYQDIRQLLRNAHNRTHVPARFTLLDIGFSYPPTDGATALPEEVTQYVDAVRLFSVLSDLADVRNGGLLFVSSHDAQLAVLPKFGPDDLRPLTAFPRFAAEFSNQQSHADQKRSIIRNVLIEQFRPRRSVTLADVLAKFEAIATDARHSLEMYMAEFSVAKVKEEVERQNLDDTLSLNKTLADIQNQLLALPAAILLAGATIKIGENLRNYAVFIGVLVFTIFVLALISNQRHSIDAIDAQVARRKAKVKNMPGDSGAGILQLFDALEDRVTKQKRTLTFIKYVIGGVVVLTGLAVINVNENGLVIDSLHRAWKFFGSP
ncbi:MAG: hypothetical protein H3C50_11690 [Kiritimatiellae bacterium]|nr:hypothetical protein [Kiritimatiellia bacterium]